MDGTFTELASAPVEHRGPECRADPLELRRQRAEDSPEAVTDAFALGLGSAFRFGAFVALGGLVLALLLIRNRPPADEVAAEALDER